MTLYARGKNMRWQLDNIRFLHPPDDFMGAFTNEKMQARHKALQDEKIRQILHDLESENNPFLAMLILNPLEHVRFLLNNLEKFKAAGCLEKAALLLYYRKNTPFASAGDYDVWKFLFENCDRDRMYSEGQPFPHTTITAYRGSVTGVPRGFSWTVSKEKAAWILEQWQNKELGGGTVFALEISRQDILAYIEDDRRQEVVLVPEKAENREPVIIESL